MNGLLWKLQLTFSVGPRLVRSTEPPFFRCGGRGGVVVGVVLIIMLLRHVSVVSHVATCPLEGVLSEAHS